jgi:hypothetical protein
LPAFVFLAEDQSAGFIGWLVIAGQGVQIHGQRGWGT